MYHELSFTQEVLITLLRPKLDRVWAEKIKPKVRERVARHSPELARALDEATHEVLLHPLPGEPNWHVIRFSKQLHTAGPPAPR